MQNWKRRVSLFLAGQTISLFGSSLVQYALMWHLTLETRSGAIMTGYILAGFLPALLLSPIAGVWADRYNRKKIIAIADGFIALVSLAAAFILRAGANEIALFFTVAALRSFGTAVHQPAVGAYLPHLVPQEELTRVNGINTGIQSALMLISPLAAGALLAVASIPVIFLIDVVTASVAIAILLLFVKSQAPAKNEFELETAKAGANTNSQLSDFLDGLKYIRSHRYLVSFFLYMGAMFFLVSPAAFLTTIQTARTFGTEVWRLTAIEIVFSVGMMAGGALIALWGGFKNRIRTILLANVIMAVCTMGLAISPAFSPSFAFTVYLSFMGVFGIAIPLFNTPSTVILQEHVEDAYLGRVFSVFTMISSSFMPLAMLFFGPLADTISIDLILLGSGIAMIILVVAVPLNRRLMQAGEPVEKK